MNAYALMLQNGEGVYADYIKASKYYVMAISLNNLSAVKNYTLMCHYNIPVEYNTHCLKLSENAEDNPTIMHLCATIYQYRSLHNDKNAIEFYKKAIIKGNVESMLSSSDDGDLIPVDFFPRSEEKQIQSEYLHSQNDLIKKETIQTEEAKHLCLNGFESKFGLEISSSSDDNDLIPVDFFHRLEETKETQNQDEDFW